MQEFSSSDGRHDFKVDGRTYWMPGVTVGDLEEVAALAKLEGEEQIAAFRDLVTSRVQPQTRSLWQRLQRIPTAPDAVRSLSIKQVADLFKEWSTMGGALKPGE